jgi:hypothetical protein
MIVWAVDGSQQHAASAKSPAMSNLQAFLLGMIVALTPSAIVLAILLWRAPNQVSSGQSNEPGSQCDELKNEEELPVIPCDQQKNLIPDIDGHAHHDARH